jgi:hypothetical protein
MNRKRKKNHGFIYFKITETIKIWNEEIEVIVYIR